MKFKRNIYAIILATVIYFALSLVYSKFILKDEFTYVYFISKNVSRGNRILETELLKVKVSSDIANNYLSIYQNDLCYKDDYQEGMILSKNMTMEDNEYIKYKSNAEILSLKLNSSEDAVSYQIERGSIVNIFYSAKLSEVESIINSIDKANIVSNNLENGYVTVKLLEDVKIVNCYGKDGNVAVKGNLIDTILLEVQTAESIKINNLKNYGKFSVSLIK